MANYSLIMAKNASNYWAFYVNGGTEITSGNPLLISPNDTVTFSTAFSSTPVTTLSGFSSTLWTSSANGTIYFNSFFDYQTLTKTVKASPTVQTDTISISNSQGTGATYIRWAGSADTTPTDDWDSQMGIDIYNATAATYYYERIDVTGINTNITVTCSLSGGSGATVGLTTSGDYVNGTYSSSITVAPNSFFYIRMYTGADDYTVTYSCTSGGVTGTKILSSGEQFAAGTLFSSTPASGAIKFSDFMEHFGCNIALHSYAPDKKNSLSDYYYGGSCIPAISQNSSTPSSGQISFSQLYSRYSRYYAEQWPDTHSYIKSAAANGHTGTITFNLSEFAIDYGQQEWCSEINVSFVENYSYVIQNGAPTVLDPYTNVASAPSFNISLSTYVTTNSFTISSTLNNWTYGGKTYDTAFYAGWITLTIRNKRNTAASRTITYLGFYFTFYRQ